MAQPQFKFRLEVLLEHRKRVEKEHQRKVAVINQQMQTLTRQIQEAQIRIVQENKTLTTQKLVGVLDMQYIAHEKRYVGNLHLKIAMTLQQLAGVEKQLQAARAELLLAARARKVIEKLKEKQKAAWLAELDRKEAALLDEIGTQGAVREANRATEEAANNAETSRAQVMGGA